MRGRNRRSTHETSARRSMNRRMSSVLLSQKAAFSGRSRYRTSGRMTSKRPAGNPHGRGDSPCNAGAGEGFTGLTISNGGIASAYGEAAESTRQTRRS